MYLLQDLGLLLILAKDHLFGNEFCFETIRVTCLPAGRFAKIRVIKKYYERHRNKIRY